ncbi:MAG: hypothetical protein JSS09_02275, partial [Verrucomicrobia bacterium]|nr:hypothetical protein [Verrucomicrobiota bacterium]
MEEKINQIVVRVAVLLGYSIDIEDISAVQVKPLHRLEHGQVVGLYNPAIYPQLTQMFKFLHLLKLDRLKVLLFLVLAKAMVKDDEVRRNASNQYPIWISLHPTLYMYPSLQDISNAQYALEKCLKQQLKQETIKENSESEKEDDQYIPSHKHIPFRGLNYITNSCYMDSVLVALFAISNDTINTYLLEKDI